jgi:hypothetical protein
VDEVQVEVVSPQGLEGDVEALLDAVVVRAPATSGVRADRGPLGVRNGVNLHLGGDEDVLAGHTRVLDTLTDLVLVLRRVRQGSSRL